MKFNLNLRNEYFPPENPRNSDSDFTDSTTILLYN